MVDRFRAHLFDELVTFLQNKSKNALGGLQHKNAKSHNKNSQSFDSTRSSRSDAQSILGKDNKSSDDQSSDDQS